MARKYPKIVAKAYITVNGQKVDVDTLNPAQRSYLGACLQVQMLNAAYAGKARFWAEGLPPKEEVFPPDAQYGTEAEHIQN